MSILNQKNLNAGNVRLDNKDLIVYVIDDSENLDKLKNMYSIRTRLNKEFWLLDVSIFSTIRESSLALKELQIDFDDDVFLHYAGTKGQVEIFEFYEIYPNHPRKILPYGNWSEEFGLQCNTIDKWVRRSNLEVNNH